MQENAENGADDPEQIKGELCVAEASESLHIPSWGCLPLLTVIHRLISKANQLRLCDPGVSHLADPTEWMRYNKEHVINIARNLLSLEITVGDIYPVRCVPYLLDLSIFKLTMSSVSPCIHLHT